MHEIIGPIAEWAGGILLNYVYSKTKDKITTIYILRRLKPKLDQIKIVAQDIDMNDRNRAITKTMYKWDHPTTENLRSRLGDKNVNFIYEYHLKDEFIGYSIIYPINQNCVNKFRNKKYTSGSDIVNKDIANDFNNCSGYYIAYLIAFDKQRKTAYRRALVAMKCEQQLSIAMKKCVRQNVYVLTKPTDNTIKAIKGHKFEKISSNKGDNDSIFSIDKNLLMDEKRGFSNA